MKSLRVLLPVLMVFSWPAASQVPAAPANAQGPFPRAATFLKQKNTLPHLVFGGYWHTRITLLNTTGNPVTVPVQFFDNKGAALKVPLKLYGTLSYVEIYVPAYSTRVVETGEQPGDPLQEGWMVATLPVNDVLIFATFGTVGVPGRPDLESTVFPVDNRAKMLSIPFNNKDGYSTGIAIAAHTCATNPEVHIDFKYDDELYALFHQYDVNIPCPGHTSFSLPDSFPDSKDRTGYVQVFCNQSPVAALGLLFNPKGGAFSTIPGGEWLPPGP